MKGSRNIIKLNHSYVNRHHLHLPRLKDKNRNKEIRSLTKLRTILKQNLFSQLKRRDETISLYKLNIGNFVVIR